LSARISLRTRLALIGKLLRRNCLAMRHGTQLRVSHRRQTSWQSSHKVVAGADAVHAITVTRPQRRIGARIALRDHSRSIPL
jgi:hypothetical protein